MVSVPPIEHTRRPLLADEFIALAEAGHFADSDDHVELLEGDIWIMSPQGPRHRLVSGKIGWAIGQAYGSARYHVATHSSMRLSDRSVPEPDVAVTRGSFEDWAALRRLPGPMDLVLAVEVVHTTERADRFKQRLYARAGVATYWFVDLVHDRVEVMNGPQDDGSFAATTVFEHGQHIPLPELETTLSVRELLLL